MIIHRPSQRINFVPGIGIHVITPQAAAASWWLSGGISAANCIAAYQAKGAASYAASKINLANPGLYNAIEAPNAPNWSSARGWYRSDNTGELRCNGLSVSANQTWTLIVFGKSPIWWVQCYANISNSVGVGIGAGNIYTFYSGSTVTLAGYGGGTEVLAVSGANGYVNGIPVVGGMTAGTSSMSAYAYGSTAGNPYADVYAVAWYNPVISDPQILAVSMDMLLL